MSPRKPGIVGITLSEFAEATGCHFSTASRLRAGTRMPGRELFDRIVKGYNLDPLEALTAFCGTQDDFGAYLRTKVFDVIAEDIEADRARSAASTE
jgi:transcriptional regulator with XRE-family HTH domain